MATHDYVLADAAGAAFRSDLNNALAAIVSQNSSATEPTTTYAYMPWFDTTNGILKFRNASNTGWVVDDLNSARGSVTMHATTMDIWAEPKIVDGTGSAVTITDIADAPQAGAVRILYPVTGTTITDGATFDVDGGQNYTTEAGDALIFEAVTTSTFKVHIVKADGTSVVASIPAGVWELIDSDTASSSASISLTGYNSTTHRDARIIGRFVKVSSDGAQITLRTSTNGGSSYDSGASDYRYAAPYYIVGGSVTADGSNGTNAISLTSNVGVGNAAGEFCSFDLNIPNPGAAQPCGVFGQCHGINAAGASFGINVSGWRTAEADVDAFQIIPSAGNLASGTFELWALRK